LLRVSWAIIKLTMSGIIKYEGERQKKQNKKSIERSGGIRNNGRIIWSSKGIADG
jgi:hypothetical protein